MSRVFGTLRSQLLLAFLAVGLLPLTVAVSLAFLESRDALLTQQRATPQSQAEMADTTAEVTALATAMGALWAVSAGGIVIAAPLMARRIARRPCRTSAFVDASARSLTASSEQIRTTAQRTSERAGAARAASDEVNDAIAILAAAMADMNTSLGEIARSSQDASIVASNAADTVADTNRIVERLDTSSAGIGDVINVITSIARQTHLLALNAIIEAARAGEAGRGFGVVANEVKELAQQAAAATEDVSQRIAAIQTDADGAVAAIAEITHVISAINVTQRTIASAVEDQTATTTDIAQRVTEAARSLTNVIAAVSEVAALAEQAETGVRDVRGRADELSTTAADLAGYVGATVARTNATAPTPAAGERSLPPITIAEAPAADTSIFALRKLGSSESPQAGG